MKRWLVAVVAVASLMASTAGPAFANATFTEGPGQPAAAGSNSGSTSGQVNRSTTGTDNKFTHDGYRWVVD